MKIRTISGRKAISVMIAPSWFWKKNLALSDLRAGSCLLAAFHIRLPAIAKIAIPTRMPISSGKVSVVELVLAEQNDPGDLAADGNDPRERGENAKALGGGLLAVRRTPFLGDVDLCGRLVVGHVQIPHIDTSARRTSNGKPNSLRINFKARCLGSFLTGR